VQLLCRILCRACGLRPIQSGRDCDNRSLVCTCRRNACNAQQRGFALLLRHSHFRVEEFGDFDDFLRQDRRLGILLVHTVASMSAAIRSDLNFSGRFDDLMMVVKSGY
jgi:hypothetical protein